MSDELKPCPWCQRQPRHIECLTPADFDNGWLVGCVDHYEAFAPTLDAAITSWNARAADAEIAALRAERDALRLSLDESVKELSRTVQQMNELNRSYAELKAHSTGNLTVTMRERDRLQQQIAALTAERDALKAERKRYAAETLTYFGKAAEHAERIAALTREPDEMELCVAANEALMAIFSTPNSREAGVKAARAILAAFIAGRRKS